MQTVFYGALTVASLRIGTLTMKSVSLAGSVYNSAFLLALFCAAFAPAYGDTYHVDVRNETGTANGSPAHPFTDIQSALDAAHSGDSVLVAQGKYAGNITVNNKQVVLRGGYAGGSSDQYNSGSSGDFSEQLPKTYVTEIAGESDAPALLLIYDQTSGTEISGLTVSGGSCGVVFDHDYTWPRLENITLSDMVIQGNGTQDQYTTGGGMFVTGSGHSIRNSAIRDNESGFGAGIYLNADNVTIQDCHIADNQGHGDHGAGIYQGGSAVIERCIISGNRVGVTAGHGWGGGLLLAGTVTMRHNRIYENYSPSGGGGVFADEGAVVTLDHELIYGNRSEDWFRGAAGIYVDGGPGGPSAVEITHCTIAFNQGDGSSGGNGVYVELESSAVLRNCILWGNGGDDFYTDESSTVTATYTLSEEVIDGTGNFSLDPLFADAAGGDFHLRSTAGRFEPAGGGAGNWVTDAADSPAIDTGDPGSPFALEPEPNGERANLGAYGNTPEASKSADASEGEPPAVPHPADADGNGFLKKEDAIGFIEGWQQGTNAMATAIRALYISEKGGSYSYDPALPEPECWVSR